jgi:centromere/kinetochore protein ZW10
MAPSAQDQPAEQVAQALVNFSLYGSFPEEDVSALNVGSDELPAAIRALSEAKSKLEVCLRLSTITTTYTWPSTNSIVSPRYTRSTRKLQTT